MSYYEMTINEIVAKKIMLLSIPEEVRTLEEKHQLETLDFLILIKISQEVTNNPQYS